jgi:MraZ protein
MHRGEFTHNLDTKGRIILPQKLRGRLSDRFVITRGLEKCLFVYSLQEWEGFEKLMLSLPFTDPKVRRFQRFFYGGAHEAETDIQGRTIIPPHLREYAGLTKDVVTMGLPDRIEIWSGENWEKYNNDENFVDDDLASYITEIMYRQGKE